MWRQDFRPDATRNTDIPSGKHQLRVEFKYDGGGLAKGGDVTLY
jgi:arylsulfatase